MIHKVIQRRINISTNFHTQTWAAYEKGFGLTELEYWLGKLRTLFKNDFLLSVASYILFFEGVGVVLIKLEINSEI